MDFRLEIGDMDTLDSRMPLQIVIPSRNLHWQEKSLPLSL